MLKKNPNFDLELKNVQYFYFLKCFFSEKLDLSSKIWEVYNPETNKYVHEYIYEHNLSLFCGFLNVSITFKKKHLNPRLQRLNMSKNSRLKSQNLNYNMQKAKQISKIFSLNMYFALLQVEKNV